MDLTAPYRLAVGQWSTSARALLDVAVAAVPVEPLAPGVTDVGDVGGPELAWLEQQGIGPTDGAEVIEQLLRDWLVQSEAVAREIERAASHREVDDDEEDEMLLVDRGAAEMRGKLIDAVTDVAPMVDAAAESPIVAAGRWNLDASSGDGDSSVFLTAPPDVVRWPFDDDDVVRAADLRVSYHVGALLHPTVSGGQSVRLVKVGDSIDTLETAAGTEIVGLGAHGLTQVTGAQLTTGIDDLFGHAAAGRFTSALGHLQRLRDVLERAAVEALEWLVGYVERLIPGAGGLVNRALDALTDKVQSGLGSYVGDALGLVLGSPSTARAWAEATALGTLPADAVERASGLTAEGLADIARVTRIRDLAESTLGKPVVKAAGSAVPAFYAAYVVAIVAGMAYCAYELRRGLVDLRLVAAGP